MIIVSIDPGINGAISFFVPGEKISVFDIPTRKKNSKGKIKNEIDPVSLQDILRSRIPADQTAVAVMESLNTFAGGSVQSMGSLDATKAVICAVLELNRLDIKIISPKMWQKHFGIKSTPKENTKAQSLRIARQIFGHEYCPLAKHDGRADSLLIGRYAMEVML